MTKPRVVILRGQQANPWDLRPLEDLRDSFDVQLVVTGSNLYGLRPLDLASIRVRALSDFVPGRRMRSFWSGAPFNRYLGLGAAVEGADIVHAAELGTWYSAEAARAKGKHGYRLALTVWETIPFLDTYRRAITRPNRRRTAAAADLFLAVTERAGRALLLEGIPQERIEVSPPGIDIERFSAAGVERPAEHVLVSPGRLVWEKGHQDVLRALAALRKGLVGAPAGGVRLHIVGSGPEEGRLRRYAAELGVADAVVLRTDIPYDEMPKVYTGASCMVLASLPLRSWEEQFGMVLAEAMTAGLPIVASSSGAIPEVAGDEALYFTPGDWLGLAQTLAQGPLAKPPGTRVDYPPERLERYSSHAAAERLATAYERVLAGT